MSPPRLRFRDLIDFFHMVVALVVGLIKFTLTEVETFLLAVVAVLVGLQTDVLVGVTVYFASYFVMRMLGGYVSMLASGRRTGSSNV